MSVRRKHEARVGITAKEPYKICFPISEQSQFDLIWEGRWRLCSRAHFVVERFNQNLSVFTTSWALEKPVPDRLHLCPLEQLSTPKLACLRDIVRRGWQMTGAMPPGTDWRACHLIWAAPMERTRRGTVNPRTCG